MLTIVLRLSIKAGLTNEGRICSAPRHELVYKCVKSLVQAIKHAEHLIKIKLIVVNQNSEQQYFLPIIQLFETYNIDYSINEVISTIPNDSALYQFVIARDCEGLVYMVEDDYLHAENAISEMLISKQYFETKTKLPVAIHPYDDIIKYNSDTNIKLCYVVCSPSNFWRTTWASTNTIMIDSTIIKNNWSTFEKLAKEYPEVMEDDTINKLWYKFETNEGNIVLFSPIPSLAIHLGVSIQPQIDIKMFDWKNRWNEISVDIL